MNKSFQKSKQPSTIPSIRSKSYHDEEGSIRLGEIKARGINTFLRHKEAEKKNQIMEWVWIGAQYCFWAFLAGVFIACFVM